VLDIAHEVTLAREQVRNAADIEPDSLSVDFNQRGPASGPFHEALHERCITFRIGRNGDQ
jgi:hypothetical protein